MTAAVETKLYITNFPSSATRQQLQQFFSRFGRVQECAIMWNSYAFVHYATMDEARRALEQSNGAMFLNRKLIVQLSTSRFRPQPKEINISVPQSPKQLMIMTAPSSSSITYHHPTGGSTPLPPQFNYPDFNYEIKQSSSSPLPDNQHFFHPPSPLSQEMNNYYSPFPNLPLDRMTPSSLKTNHMKLNKNIKTDIGVNGEIPKLYCTNLPDNCKANDLQGLFSSLGHVVDCVILWDYYAFITYKTFLEAERALVALNGFTWKDRHLIVEWSRASGRRQQQQTSPIPPRLGSELLTPASPRSRPSTLLAQSSVSNGQFYENQSPKILSPLKSQSFNPNLALMSIMQQPFFHQHHPSMPYNHETLSSDHQQIFDDLTHSSSSHRLDLSSFIDTNSNPLFSSSSELNTPSSAASTSHVYQPSDIIALLEPSSSSSDISVNNKSPGNSVRDITNSLPSTINNLPPSCSSAALFQENILSSLFNSFEPFNKLFPTDDQSPSSSRYNHLSPLITTAPEKNHYPISYNHHISWR